MQRNISIIFFEFVLPERALRACIFEILIFCGRVNIAFDFCVNGYHMLAYHNNEKIIT